MKFILLLFIVVYSASGFAQVGDFGSNDDDLQNQSVENDVEGLFSESEINENDEEEISQVALSIIHTGRPNCFDQSNRGRRFRHNWFITRFWECNRWRTDLRSCAIPRLYQPSKQRCVWAWNWVWEPIRRPEVTPPPTTTMTSSITATTPGTTTVTNPWDPIPSISKARQL